MKVTDIVSQIAGQHRVMSAQVEKLAEMAPPQLSAGMTNPGADAILDVLDAALTAHVANAAHSINAMAKVEAAVRASQTARSARDVEHVVIDGQFREVDEHENR